MSDDHDQRKIFHPKFLSDQTVFKISRLQPSTFHASALPPIITEVAKFQSFLYPTGFDQRLTIDQFDLTVLVYLTPNLTI
jgi:hypothetical protein